MRFSSFEKKEKNMFVRLFICVFLPLAIAYPSNKCKNYCLNEAVCVIKQDEPVCYCLPEWEGEQCDLVRQENFSVEEEEQGEGEIMERSSARSPECLLAPPNMCLNRGICRFENNSYSCECQPEFTGKRCKEPSRMFFSDFLGNFNLN